ncbi:hypothetical protein F4808DRAFT_421023 [Astrocystis sublimbata]|nr:hypothetical protein F4808DRAFT_421023 [Astrocystis sublimbata]
MVVGGSPETVLFISVSARLARAGDRPCTCELHPAMRPRKLGSNALPPNLPAFGGTLPWYLLLMTWRLGIVCMMGMIITRSPDRASRFVGCFLILLKGLLCIGLRLSLTQRRRHSTVESLLTETSTCVCILLKMCRIRINANYE